MKKNFVIPILIIIAVITVPIGINILTIFKMPFGSGSTDSWVGFFGGYIGGILGAIIAFYISKYQVRIQIDLFKKQIENEKEKEKKQREYNQLPYLIRLKYIIKNIKQQLDFPNKLVNEEIPSQSGSGKMKFTDFDTFKLENFKLSSDDYNIFNNIYDSKLTIETLELFNFYDKFFVAVGCSTLELEASLKLLENKLNKKNIGDEKNKIESQWNTLNADIQYKNILKQSMWEKLKEDKCYDSLCRIEKELEEKIKRVKEINEV